MRKKEQLRKQEFFQGLKEETVERICEAGKISEFSKGDMIIRAHMPCDYLYFQLSGKTIIYNLTHQGKRKILFIFGAGNWLNEHILNMKNPSIYCEVIDDCRVFLISKREFEKAMKADFELTRRILGIQETKGSRLMHQLKNVGSGMQMEKKLAVKIWKMARDFGVDREAGREIDMNISITFLGDMLGVSRETTSRMCSNLAERGLILMNKKRIIVPDLEKLISFCRTNR